MSKYFSFVYSGEIREDSEKKVIPQEEFNTLLTAQQVLEKAKEDVDQYLEKNKKDCELFAEEAKDLGHKQGLLEFNKQILYFNDRINQIELDLQKQLLPLTLKAAKKVLGVELETNPEAIIDIIRKTITPITQNTSVKIYVSKEDRQVVEKKKKELKDILEYAEVFMIEEKDDIKKGDCIVETETGIINASLENQWNAMESAFKAFTNNKN